MGNQNGTNMGTQKRTAMGKESWNRTQNSELRTHYFYGSDVLTPSVCIPKIDGVTAQIGGGR